jgi:hypothetical protein
MTPKTITIPAELVPHVRSGAYRELYKSLKSVGEVIQTGDHENPSGREQHVELFTRIDGARMLLDRIRWSTGGRETPAEIDLYQYHPALRAALVAQLQADGIFPDASSGRATPAGRVESLRRLLEEIGDVAPERIAERPGEHLILFALLSPKQERPEWRTVTQIEDELYDLDPEGVRFAIDGLVAGRLAVRDGERLKASHGARHLDALGVICVCAPTPPALRPASHGLCPAQALDTRSDARGRR